LPSIYFSILFFFTSTPTTEIYTLSLHDALPIFARFGNEEQRHRWVTKLAAGELLGAFSLSEAASGSDAAGLQCRAESRDDQYIRSEEHTSELQSPCNLVCRLLLEKKKKKKN